MNDIPAGGAAPHTGTAGGSPATAPGNSPSSEPARTDPLSLAVWVITNRVYRVAVSSGGFGYYEAGDRALFWWLPPAP